MKIDLSEVLSVIIFCPLILQSFPSQGGRAIALSSEYKLTNLILHVGCPSHNATSYRKSAFIHKPLVKIAKALNQHDTAGKTMKYLGINTLISQND